MTHQLKIAPKYFRDILFRGKRFELRKDDRNYKIMDMLELQEFEGGKFTGGRILAGPVEYILRNAEEYGLPQGYCILGFRDRWQM